MTATMIDTRIRVERDAELDAAVASARGWLRAFYVVVLLIALTGQVSGATERLSLDWYIALGVALPLELGAIAVLHNADVRRRLNERAIVWRLLSAGISLGSVTWAWVSHADHKVGGFCAGFSLLGYLVYLLDTEARRRDRLRATGQMSQTTPAYELLGHWVRHPWITRRAKALAKATPALQLHGSLDAANNAVRRERQEKAITAVLHRKIRSSVDKDTADIATSVYDLTQIAARLAASADYDGLTALIAADLAPARIAAAASTRETRAHVPVSDSLIDTGLGQLLAGTLPGVVPVSPAPAGSARSPRRTSPRTPDQTLADLPGDPELDLALDLPADPARTSDRTSTDPRPDPDQTGPQTSARTSTDPGPDPDQTGPQTSARTSTDPGPGPDQTGRRISTRTSTRTSTAGAATAVAQLLPTAREVAEQLTATGVSVSRATLAPALRERGVAVSTTGAGALVKALKGRSEARPARRKANVKRTRTTGDAPMRTAVSDGIDEGRTGAVHTVDARRGRGQEVNL